MTALTNNQKELIAHMLTITETNEDLINNRLKILGNAYGNKETVHAYAKLAKLRIKRFT